jgi:hypothetical protein
MDGTTPGVVSNARGSGSAIANAPTPRFAGTSSLASHLSPITTQLSKNISRSTASRSNSLLQRGSGYQSSGFEA